MSQGEPSAADQVWSLVSGIVSWKRGARMAVILQGFVDDSGSGKTEPFFALGGFISTYENWARFADAWCAALRAEPSIPYFKMSNAYAKRGVFNGWDRSDIEAKIAVLAGVIKSHAMVRISSAVDRRAYNRWVSGKGPEEIDDPYVLCFYQILYATFVHQRKYRWDTQIDWIFDEQGKLGPATVAIWPQFKKLAHPSVRPYIGRPPIFRDDKQFLPLQAADLYVGALRRRLRDNRDIYLPDGANGPTTRLITSRFCARIAMPWSTSPRI